MVRALKRVSSTVGDGMDSCGKRRDKERVSVLKISHCSKSEEMREKSKNGRDGRVSYAAKSNMRS